MTGDPRDDLDGFLAEQMKSPAFAAAYVDAISRSRVLIVLLDAKRAQGLTTGQIAEAMGVKVKDVRAYEQGETDPRLSMHQRYARALGLSVYVEIKASPSVPSTKEPTE